MKFVPKGLIDNKSALVQIMAWQLFGVEPPQTKADQDLLTPYDHKSTVV